MKKILFFYISHGLQLTGGPNALYQLLKGLNKNKIYPIILSQKHDAFTKKLEECNMEVKILEFPNILEAYNKKILKYSFIKKLRTIVEIARYNIKVVSLVRRKKIDLLWAMNLRALLTIAPAAKLLRIPIVWNIWLGEKSIGYFRFLNTLGLSLANYVVTEYNNQKYDLFSKDQIVKYNHKFRVVYTGLLDKFECCADGSYDNRLRFGFSMNDIVIGTVASIIPRKGHTYVLHALKEIKKYFRDIRYLIVGDIPSDDYKEYYAYLRELVKECDLESNVFFLGSRDDIPNILSSLDIFVLTSLGEGTPMAIREAMAMAKPIVATKVGGIPEVVVDGESGLLVPAGDVDALTRAIRLIIENPEKAREMGLKARERVKELFSLNSYIENYERVLNEM